MQTRETKISPQMFQDGLHSAGIGRLHSTRASRTQDSARIAFLRICGEGYDSLRSRHFLRVARCQISEDLVSAALAWAVSILEIQDLAIQDSSIQGSAARSSDRICRS